MSLNRSRVVFLCFWGLLWTLAYSAQGVTFRVQGIGLAKLLEEGPGNLSGTVEIDETATHIHEMLKNYPWTSCSLEDTEIDILDMEQACSDTDDSISSKKGKNQEKRFYQRTKNLKANNRKGSDQFEDTRETYIKLNDIDLKNDDPTENTKRISSYLSEKATEIAWSATAKRAAAQTTCLCVMLIDKQKRGKQLVFHNLKNYLPSTMHNTAIGMGIGMRGNERMHAEASFLGFLLHRAAKKEYIHVLGMGCSKKHCQECDALLKLFLGSGYQEVTAAVTSSNKECDFSVKHPSEPNNVVYFRHALKGNAIRIQEKPSKKFLLDNHLRKHIKLKYGLATLPIDGDRFRDDGSSEIDRNTKTPIPKRQKKEK